MESDKFRAYGMDEGEGEEGRGGGERGTIDRYGSFARFPVIARKTEY